MDSGVPLIGRDSSSIPFKEEQSQSWRRVCGGPGSLPPVTLTVVYPKEWSLTLNRLRRLQGNIILVPQ